MRKVKVGEYYKNKTEVIQIIKLRKEPSEQNKLIALCKTNLSYYHINCPSRGKRKLCVFCKSSKYCCRYVTKSFYNYKKVSKLEAALKGL